MTKPGMTRRQDSRRSIGHLGLRHSALPRAALMIGIDISTSSICTRILRNLHVASASRCSSGPRSFASAIRAVKEEIGKVIVGHDDIVHGVLTCLFVGGHCLLEGVPGLGKTLLVRTLAEALDLDFNRIQFTPDLMPADIIGTNIVMETPDGQRDLRVPARADLLADRPGRRDQPGHAQDAVGPARSDAGSTRSPSAATIHQLKEPFFVMATQNPIEQEGTYPLPEAQLDRFLFKLVVGYSTPRGAGHDPRPHDARRARPRPSKVMDGADDRAVAAPGPRGDRRAARAGLRDPAGPGDASRRAVRRCRSRTSTSAGAPARAAPRRWCWRPRCGPCSTAGTTSASRTSGASTCRPAAPRPAQLRGPGRRGSIPIRCCWRFSRSCRRKRRTTPP